MPTINLNYSNTVITDTWIKSGQTASGFPTDTAINVGVGQDATTIFRSLLKFDLGLIPNDAIISSAKLNLYKILGNAAAQTLDIHTITSDWPNNVGWGAQPSFKPTPSVSVLLAANLSNQALPYIDITSIVQSWVNGDPNYGLLMKYANESTFNTYSSFASNENATTANRPTLTITYTIPTTGKKQVEYVGSSYTTDSSAQTSMTCPLPAGVQSGDYVFALINKSSQSIGITLPGGWTMLYDEPNSQSGIRFSVAYRKIGNGESNPRFTSASGSAGWSIVLIAFRNVKIIGTTGRTHYTTASNTFSPPQITASADDTLLFLVNQISAGSAATPPLSFDEKYDANNGGAGRSSASLSYMHKKRTLTTSEMTTTIASSTYGLSTAIVLEPITNNPLTLTLTSPADNQTLSEGNKVQVEGSATDPDANDPVTIYLQVNNGTPVAIHSDVSDGSTAISFARQLEYRNKRIYYGITDLTGSELAENTDHSLKVWASDNKGGKSAEVTRAFRVIHNRPPVISGENGDLGIHEVAPTVTYSVTEPESNAFTVIEKINGVELRSFAGVAGRQEHLEISFDAWLRLEPSVLHTLTIEATDSNGLKSTRTHTFTRFEDRIEFEIEEPWTTDVAAKRNLFTLDSTLPPGAILVAEACNNAFDVLPSWEDITFNVRYKRGYVFLNNQKTAPTWGVNVRVRIEKGTATEPIEINGFGGAFD